MGRAKSKGRNRKRSKTKAINDNPTAEPVKLKVVLPTPELSQHGVIELPEINQAARRTASRRVPVIETMFRNGYLTDREFVALGYYRDQALITERSEMRDSLNRDVVVATGKGPSAAYVSAALETGRIERDLGSLRAIARAVAVEDIPLSAWCVRMHGGRERYDGKGKFIAIVPLREAEHMKIARCELRHAAMRIVR